MQKIESIYIEKNISVSVMSSYVEEINVALSMRGEGYYFETMEEVRTALEDQSETYRNKSITYGSFSASLIGAGIFAEAYPEIFDPYAEASFLSTSDWAHIALASSFAASLYPARKTKKYRKNWKKAKVQAKKIEEESFDDSDTDFAYEIVETLDDSGIDIIHRMNEKIP